MHILQGALVVLLLAAICCGVADTRTHSPDIEAAIKDDPSASRDFLGSLPLREKMSFLKSIRDDAWLPPILKKPQVTIEVDIVLLGFNGEGHGEVIITDWELLKHLRALHLTSRIEDVISREELSVLGSFVFHVRKAARHITDEIEGAIKLAVEAGSPHTSADAPLIQIPHSVVEQIITRELETKKHNKRTTLYLLNPESPGVPYAYQFATDTSSCASAMWPGRARFLWVDIQAGPVSFNVRSNSAGKGQTHFSYLQQDWKADKPRLLAEMASFVMSAVHQVLWTPLHHVTKEQYKSTHVQIVSIHDLDDATEHATAHNYDIISRELQGLVPAGSQLTFDHKRLPLAHCDACIEALSSSLMTQTLLQQSSEISVMEHNFLDSAQMRIALTANKDRIFNVASVPQAAKQTTAGHRVIAVFVFHLSSREALLFDDGKQSVGFPSLVMGIVTRSGDIPSAVECNGVPMLMRSQSLTRPLLDAILLAGWGVPPPLESAAGAGVFSGGNVTRRLYDLQDGPFNLASMHWTPVLSFIQVEAARRNWALNALHIAQKRAQELFEAMAKLSEYCPHGRSPLPVHEWLSSLRAPPHLREELSFALLTGAVAEAGAVGSRPRARLTVQSTPDVVDAREQAELWRKLHMFAGIVRNIEGGKECLQRMHTLEYKLRRAGVALGQMDYDSAMWLALSSRHDADAIRKFADASADKFRLALMCPASAGTRVLSYVLPCVVLFAPSAAVLVWRLTWQPPKRKHF